MNEKNNPYADMIAFTRDEGAYFNASGIELGSVASVSPLRIRVAGVDISQNLYAMEGASFTAGDDVAICRISEDATLLFGKVMKA